MFLHNVKETLRIHPTVTSTGRQVLKNDILPLSIPILARDGQTKLHQISVQKGTIIELDIYSANLDGETWGQDSEIFKPERWLEIGTDKNSGVGLYYGLMNFIHGPRACIGYKFSILQSQLIVFELMENFQFLPVPGLEIGKAFNFFVNAYVKGREGEGVQLPLLLKSITA